MKLSKDFANNYSKFMKQVPGQIDWLFASIRTGTELYSDGSGFWHTDGLSTYAQSIGVQHLFCDGRLQMRTAHIRTFLRMTSGYCL